jgi:hypothetical protein
VGVGGEGLSFHICILPSLSFSSEEEKDERKMRGSSLPLKISEAGGK